MTNKLIQGASLSTVMVAQFTLFQHLLAPGKRPVRELATLPIFSGLMFGFTIGMIRVISHP